jgi:hypothetical protein
VLSEKGCEFARAKSESCHGKQSEFDAAIGKIGSGEWRGEAGNRMACRFFEEHDEFVNGTFDVD